MYLERRDRDILKQISLKYLKRIRKTSEIPVLIFGVPAEIRRKHFPSAGSSNEKSSQMHDKFNGLTLSQKQRIYVIQLRTF